MQLTKVQNFHQPIVMLKVSLFYFVQTCSTKKIIIYFIIIKYNFHQLSLLQYQTKIKTITTIFKQNVILTYLEPKNQFHV